MGVLKEEHGVYYVEPNAIDSVTSYKGVYGETTTKSPALEDMSIAVNLEVEIKGRTYSGSREGTNTNYVMTWQSTNNGQVVHFMSGSKLYTDETQTNYVNSLTTNYASANLRDVIEASPAECFGIKSIDISYNNFMVPEVTIQFIDVRGVSLFAAEELRHNVVEKGVSYSANNDIEGSFFKCFFTFPYPRFTLKVKGFYGEMASYDLTCSDFRSAFDSITGNFNVTAKFVGYAFSFLNDVMVNALVAAPYSEYIGGAYWESNVSNSRFTITDKNGSRVTMPKLGEICKAFKMIQENVANRITEEGLAQAAANLGESQETIDAIQNNDKLKGIREIYNSMINNLKNHYLNDKDGDCRINPDGTNSFCFIVKNEDEDLNQWIKDFSGVNNEIKDKTQTQQSQKLKEWFKNHNFEITKKEKYTDIIGNNDQVNGNIIKEPVLRNEINKKAGEKFKDNTTYKQIWNDSKVYFYQDFGLNEILTENNSDSQQAQQEAEQIRQRVANKLVEQEFEKVFNFKPTVENITKIIMAHFETYVQMISKCAENIINSGSKRMAEKLGINKDNFPDCDGSFIYPFPQFAVEYTGADGVKKREDGWLGTLPNATNNFEEVKLVEGLLKGIEEAVKEMAIVTNTPTEDNEPEPTRSSLAIPLSYVDLFLEAGDNPYGKVDVSNIEDVMATLAVRLFASVQNSEKQVNYTNMGKYEAQNFLARYGSTREISSIKALLKDLKPEQVFNFLRGKTHINTALQVYPWKGEESLLGHDTRQDRYYLYGVFRNEASLLGELIPVRNWNWAKWYNDFKGHEEVNTNDFKNYFTTSKPKKRNDSTAFLYKVKYAPLEYIHNSIGNISDGELQRVFNEALDLNNDYVNTFNELYCGNKEIFRKNGDFKRLTDVLEYDATGKPNGADSYTMNFWNLRNGGVPIFTTEQYDTHSSDYEKAMLFLSGGLPLNRKNNLRSDFVKNSTVFKYMPKFAFLQMCSKAYIDKMTKQLKKNERSAWVDFLCNEFEKWVNGPFQKIKKFYELKFINGSTPSKFQAALKKFTNTDDDEKIKGFLKLYIDLDKFLEAYEIVRVTDGHIYAYNKPTSIMAETITELLQVACVCAMTQFNVYGSSTMIKKDKMLEFFGGVLSEMKSTLQVDSGVMADSAQLTLDINDIDDIKIGVYRYVKMLYDKWIASNTQSKEYTMEKMFYDEDHSFHFIDSFYNKVGSDIYMNLGSLVDSIIACQSRNGYTLLSMLSSLYASNKFMLLCIQNFLDLSNGKLLGEMFTPIPYIKAQPPKSRPNFIVMYPYEASSKLDVKGSDFPDDTFYLNEASTYPVMITQKSADDYKIPAFGVSYGQQYQSYFKNIQVDMNSPMTTEQSIKAKFLVAGLDTGTVNAGPRHITVGQDLYTIYSNNSYTCTVTMLGCAWIQPMMYFVLQNVPMFRGSYMICKVTHQIEPGNMTTTFTGVRMAKTATRAVKKYIYGTTLNSSSETGGQYDFTNSNTNSNADIGNDCEYAYYSPTDNGGMGGIGGEVANINQITVKGTPPNADQRKNLNDLLPLCYAEKDKLKYGMPWNLIAAIIERECTWNSKTIYGGKTSSAGAKGCTQFKYETAGEKKYSAYFKNLNDIAGKPDDRNDPKKCIPCTTIYLNSWAAKMEKEKKYNIRNKKGEIIYSHYTHPEILKNPLKTALVVAASFNGGHWGLGPWGDALLNSDVETVMASPKQIGPPETNKYVRGVYRALPVYVKASFSGATTNNGGEFKPENLGYSVERSLNSTQSYRDAKVTTTSGKDGWISLKVTGENATNAAFDCLIQTYKDYFDKIDWEIQTASTNSDAKMIYVHTVKSSPAKRYIFVTSGKTLGKDIDAVKLTKAEDVNNSLKLSMIKYFKSNGITDVKKAKDVFRSIANMPDETVKKVFELGDVKSITDCSSLNGYTGGVGNPNSSANSSGRAGQDTKNGRFIIPHSSGYLQGDEFDLTEACKAAAQFTLDEADRAGDNTNVENYHHNCTGGPRRALLAGFSRKYGKPKKPNEPLTRDGGQSPYWFYNNLPKRGWECILEIPKMPRDKRRFPAAAKYLKEECEYVPQEGDICLQNALERSGNVVRGSHGQIYLGGYWISDVIQERYFTVEGGNEHVHIFRYTKKNGKSWYWKS